MSFYIRKSSGKKELFDIKKLQQALRHAGADDQCVDQLSQQMMRKKDIKTTRDIHDYCMSNLIVNEPAVAIRYNLKRALQLLGPSGYAFEVFVGQLFRAQGYQVETNKLGRGWCVDHELDVVATKGDKHFMIECKFHGRKGLKTSVKVALYIKARFDDMEKQWTRDKNHGHSSHQPWIVTNTRFTSEAVKYAHCVDINLLGWSYPPKEPLPDLIHKFKVHPITALAQLDSKARRMFLRKGLVLCSDLKNNTSLLKKAGMSFEEIDALIKLVDLVGNL